MEQRYPKFSYQSKSMDHTRRERSRSGDAFNNSMAHHTFLSTDEPNPDDDGDDDSYKTMKTSSRAGTGVGIGVGVGLLAACWMRTHHRVSATYVTCAVDVEMEMEPPLEHMSTHNMQLQLRLRVGFQLQFLLDRLMLLRLLLLLVLLLLVLLLHNVLGLDGINTNGQHISSI